MYDKSVSPQAAFMTGKLKVEGDMGIALKLQSVIN
jgi:putative sterol carrier protein